MNTMNMPGFSAEASLCRSSASYQVVRCRLASGKEGKE